MIIRDINKYGNYKNYQNEIEISMFIEQKDINKKIYFLENEENEEEIEKETSENIKIKHEIEEGYDLEVFMGNFNWNIYLCGFI